MAGKGHSGLGASGLEQVSAIPTAPVSPTVAVAHPSPPWPESSTSRATSWVAEVIVPLASTKSLLCRDSPPSCFLPRGVQSLVGGQGLSQRAGGQQEQA